MHHQASIETDSSASSKSVSFLSSITEVKEVERTMTIEVSRYIGNARKLIQNAALGRFDYQAR